MNVSNDLNKRIRETGLELYRLTSDVPSIFDKRRWMGRLMEHAMKNEGFRLNLFRYIDVLPSLKTERQITDLLHEYFSGVEGLPLIIRKGVERISRGPVPFVAARLIKAAARSLAAQFIAAETARDAQKTLRHLWDDGLTSSADLLGEEVLSDKEADEYANNYLDQIGLLAEESARWQKDGLLESDDKGPIPRFDISIKVTSLYSQLDPVDWDGSIERTRANLGPIVARCRDSGASLCLDMEQYYFKDLILDIFRRVMDEFGDYDYAGVALQAYLKDSRDDLLSLIDWAKKRKRRVSVRLVKGAYWDYEIVSNTQKGWQKPVFESKEETDRNFEELTRILLENTEFVRPAIATHNIRSISHAIAVSEALGLPRNAFEFQMLYGMGVPLRRKLRKMGYRVRIYTPVGELIPGMAYLVRRLLENTSNTSFLRGFFAEKRPFEELIKTPVSKAHDTARKTSSEFRNEPAADYSMPENRKMMKRALTSAKAAFASRYPLYIDNEAIFTEREIVSLNPANPEEVVGRVSYADAGHAERAVTAAGRAWESWKNIPPARRGEYLFKAATELRKQRFDLAALEVYEAGKTWKDADADVIEAIDYLEYYGREIARLGRPLRMGSYPGEVNDYFYEPRGTCLVVSPWNFPLAISTGMVSAALVAGNCVIFKPSGLAPVTGSKLFEAFRSAGLPDGVLQFLPGPGPEVGEYLVKHKAVDMIAFTGSKDVGLRIIWLAAGVQQGQRNVKKVVAEMGGKNAIIVDETADLNEAVKGVLESALGYQGQKCSACSRVILLEGIYEEFLARLKEAIQSIRIGPPEEPGTYMGPVIDDEALKKTRWYIEKGKSEAVLLLERKLEGKGNFVGPVVFKDVTSQSVIAQEEIFGPVLAAIKAKDIDDAIDIANSTVYALTGGIFSRSPKNISKAETRFRVGNLYINRKITGALVGRQPFGGAGMSGVGSKAGGPDYILQFMNPRSVCENTMRRGFAPMD